MFKVREIAPSEYAELENFLYEAIYIPDGATKPSRKIIEQPELQVYVKDFGTQAADCGIATALLKRLLTRLAEKNFKRVSLSVQKENAAAVALYRKLNFEIIDERGAEYLMIKNLTA